MAFPNTIKGRTILIRVGDGATPEVFTVLCGLTTKSKTRQVNTSDVFLEDCADPDALPQRGVDITGEQTDLSGEGFYNKDQEELVDESFGQSLTYQFDIDSTIWQGKAVMTQHSISSQGAGRVQATMAFASDGLWAKLP